MKAERFFTALTAFALAFALSLGSVLSLASGFSLVMEDPLRLILFCALASAFCSFALVFPRAPDKELSSLTSQFPEGKRT